MPILTVGEPGLITSKLWSLYLGSLPLCWPSKPGGACGGVIRRGGILEGWVASCPTRPAVEPLGSQNQTQPHPVTLSSALWAAQFPSHSSPAGLQGVGHSGFKASEHGELTA